jgi:hypothetical protein
MSGLWLPERRAESSYGVRTAISPGSGAKLTSSAPSASGSPPPLSYLEVEPLLKQLGHLTRQIVLVGGQALNFWAEHYMERARAALLPYAPYTSRDIDFVGGQEEAKHCAASLGGKVAFPEPDHVITPNSAVVTYHDTGGTPRTIDFLYDLYAVKSQDVYRMAMPFDFFDNTGKSTGVQFLVMHPVLCLESRVSNTVGLPQYQSPHGLHQARAAVVCAREFLREVLDDAGPEPGQRVRAVLKLNQRIFRFATEDRLGREAAPKFGIEPFDAVVADDNRLPERFRTTRYPQMRRAVDELRVRQAARDRALREIQEKRISELAAPEKDGPGR